MSLFNPFSTAHYLFESGFNRFRNGYRNALAWAVMRPLVTACFFLLLIGVSLLLYPRLGTDFFPQVDAGQMRLHVRAPTGTKLEQTQQDFAKVEQAIQEIVGKDQVEVMLDNIGLPYSGINIALSDSATVGPMDGEMLIALKEKHTPTPAHVADLRRELPKRFPELKFFFQPADIVNQVLNFGQPAPIDIRVSGPHNDVDYATATKILHDIHEIPGIVDAHIFQVPNAPAMKVDVDRTIASEMGMTQRDISNSVLVTLSSSAMVSPNFWLNPTNNVTYPLLVQTPQYNVNSLPELRTVPVSKASGSQRQLLMNVAKVSRGSVPMILSQLNIRPVFDVQADLQGRDLGTIATALRKVIAKNMPEATTGVHIDLAGQVETMGESFTGLYSGMGLAVVLVFLLMVIQFQSWMDPLIVLLAVPFALGWRHVDALSDADAYQCPRVDGHADVHRADDG